MLWEFVNSFATTYYIKFTASDGTVYWPKLELVWNSRYSSYDTFSLERSYSNMEGGLDFDEVWTNAGGSGTKHTISEIASAAFFNFSKLTSISGTSVKKLRSQAFQYCISLTNINFPNLQTIESYAFANCSSLVSYKIPASVTSIAGDAFYHSTSLTNLTVDANNYNYSCENNILYNKYKTKLCAFLSCRNDTAFVVPPTIKTIDESAFRSNWKLRSVIISNGVETINENAFYSSQIKSVVIPQSVTTIKREAFGGCNYLESIKVLNPTPITLTSEVFPNTAILYVPAGSKDAYENANYWKNVSEIKEYIPSSVIQFADATVKSICVNNWDYSGDGELDEDEAKDVIELGTQFSGNTEITSFDELQYFTNLKHITASAFSGCTNLASIKVPASLTKIGQNAFQNTAWLNAQSDGLVYIGNVLYTYKGTMPANTKIVVKDGTTCICNYAFSNQTNLTEIELPNSLLYLGTEDTSFSEYGYVFNYCTGLTTIKIPAGVKDIVRYTFRGSGLKTIELPETLESIGNSSFRSCTSLESLVIPDKVRTIGKNTFRDCSKLQQVTMPSFLMSVASDAFRNCNQLKRVDISNLGGWCNVDFADYRANPLTYAHHLYLNGKEVVNFETDSYCLLPYFNSYYNAWRLANYDWETIKPLVFYGCQSIKTVSINENITSIGNSAFYNCTALESVKTEAKPFTLSTYAFPTRANVSLYTTQGCLNQYQQAAVWNEFKSIKSYPNLDVNEDGEVDVLDVVDVVNYTKGMSTTDTFVHFLADFDNDKKVTKTDAEWVAKAIPTTERFSELPATEGVTDIVLADNIQIRSGETNTASIQLQNTTDGLVGFQMDVTLPDGVSLIEKDCRLSSRIADADQKLQIGKLSDNTYRLTATSLALQSITGNDGELINITLKATELSDGGTVNIKNIRIVTDKSARLVLADAAFGVQIVDVTPAIAFQDKKVKAICLTNWDVNGDGVLSTREAAKITTIGTLFKGNTEIISFYELKHFTGLTTIDEGAFMGCSNLESVSIPENIVTIGDKAFYNCDKLKGVYAYMPTPPAITETTFTNYATATLSVCRNCKDVYDNADVWKNFNMTNTMMFKEGDGSEDNPYLLFDPDDFKNLANDVNGGTTYQGVFFKVNKPEIDFSGVTPIPIGTITGINSTGGSPYYLGNAFIGTLDGNGVIIKNWSSNKGLLINIGKFGVVKDIIMDATCIITGTGNVGGIAGASEGNILNCINRADISSTGYHIGGICGDNMGTISDCKNYGNIIGKTEQYNSTSGSMIGGIAGDTDGGRSGNLHNAIIRNCENYGTVSGASFEVGGIVGFATDGLLTGMNGAVENCINKGNVIGSYSVGGIIGNVSSHMTIHNNFVTGCTITGTKGNSYGAGVISETCNQYFSNNFYSKDVILKVGDQTYDGSTPRGVWGGYDSSTSSYLPKDITENSGAILLTEGDINTDGQTTAQDASLVLQHVAGKTPLNDNVKKVADVNGDGEVTAQDASLILQKVAGK